MVGCGNKMRPGSLSAALMKTSYEFSLVILVRKF